ncbi:hypothetical protein [Mariniphaga sediminis]|uniref:hypothetical protein n=1 Tax=Mariniphaga sediminis TaxID=1628158 RepID=UPI003567A01C
MRIQKGGLGMNQQLELIPQTKHIPQWLADYFYKANSGNYKYKQDFYEKIKNPILQHFAEFIGFELQIIEYPCHSCDGTGKFKHYYYEYGHRYLLRSEPCWHCTDGIYRTAKFTLKKYVLNGVAYHIPCDFDPNVKHLPTVVKGKIAHENIDPQEALIAYIILLWKYDKAEFYYRMYGFVKDGLKPITNLIQKLIRKDNTNDDLPF